MIPIFDIPRAFGPGDPPQPHAPLWAVFDPVWYREHYGDAVLNMTGSIPDEVGLYQFWLLDGARYAHSPNRYFDEIWYRRNNFDVENGIRLGMFNSGFQHYCETGHRGRSCHWLFSETNYFLMNVDLTPTLVREMGYVNGYDHYLSLGQIERRVSSPFLVPDLLRAGLMLQRLPFDPQIGDFTRLVLSQDAVAIRTSWYFDPVWYLERYADVAGLISRGEYASPLHHYMANETPIAYCPNPCFDEGYYLAQYPDVNEQVRARLLRNGYEHFVRFGLYGGRSPTAAINLPNVGRPGEFPGWSAICDNAYLSRVRGIEQEPASEVIGEPDLRQLAYLQALRAETLIPLLARSKLDFRYVDKPEISVIIGVSKVILDLLQTLASLQETSKGAMQVILLSAREGADARELSGYTYGLEIIVPGRVSVQQGWQRALTHVAAERVLIIEPGVTLFLGGLDAAIARLDHEEVIAVAPQSLGLDLRVAEAGLSVTRDGSCFPYGEGQEAFAPAVDFVRACDGSSGGVILCRTEALRAIPAASEALNSLRIPSHNWAALGLSLRQAVPSGRVLYEPSFLIRVPEREAVAEPLRSQEMLVIRRHFSGALRGNLATTPAIPGVLHKPARWGRRLLILAREVPLSRTAQWARIFALADACVFLGLQVTIFVLTGSGETITRPEQGLEDEIEFRSGSLETLGELIEQRRHGFDRTWICGGDTLNDAFSLLNEKAVYLLNDRYILDLRVLESVDNRADRRSPKTEQSSADLSIIELGLRDEIANAWFCHDIVVQDERQAALLRNVGLNPLLILGDGFTGGRGRSFEGRKDLLFSAQSATVPGYPLEFLEWFVGNVMTRVNERLPEPVRLILACSTTGSLDLSKITFYPHVAPLAEGQESLSDLAARCRVLIAPDEWAGQVSSERFVAGARGLPVVIGGDISLPGVRNVSLDPDQFAETVASLYQDQKLWERLSDEAMLNAEKMRSVFLSGLIALLKQDEIGEVRRDG